jgi:hypothetical protein
LPVNYCHRAEGIKKQVGLRILLTRIPEITYSGGCFMEIKKRNSSVDILIKQAEEALEEYMQMEQEQIDEIIKAMSLAGLEKQLYLAQRNRNGYCGR